MHLDRRYQETGDIGVTGTTVQTYPRMKESQRQHMRTHRAFRINFESTVRSVKLMVRFVPCEIVRMRLSLMRIKL